MHILLKRTLTGGRDNKYWFCRHQNLPANKFKQWYTLSNWTVKYAPVASPMEKWAKYLPRREIHLLRWRAKNCYVHGEIFPKLIYIPSEFLTQPGGVFRVEKVFLSSPLENLSFLVKIVSLQIPRWYFRTPPGHLDRVLNITSIAFVLFLLAVGLVQDASLY